MKVTLDGFLNQSDPYEYEDYQGEDESYGGEAVWIPLLYSVMVIVGLLGNGLVLAVLAQKARSWSVSDSFFLQLGVLDILLLFTLPFYAAHANENCGLCSPPFLRICGAIFKTGAEYQKESVLTCCQWWSLQAAGLSNNTIPIQRVAANTQQTKQMV
ncbi:C-X-C chemokine receptor type 3-like isoform 3-T3 [Fundulus diaphanus]